MLEPLIKTILVPCSQESAFKVFVNDFSTWWPLQHSVSGMQGEVAKKVSLDAKLGGQITEMCFDGKEEVWGEILSFDPFNGFSMNFHMGLTDDAATLVELTFSVESENQTKVVLTHTNWEVFGEKASKMRNGYKGGWVEVFEEAYGKACQSR